jgi:hypothetical protein
LAVLGDRQISLEAIEERLAKIEAGHELSVTRDEPALAIQAFADRDLTETYLLYPSKEEFVRGGSGNVSRNHDYYLMHGEDRRERGNS